MEFTAEAAPERFLGRARPLLLSNEARYNLILGIAGTLVEHPDAYRAAFLWLVEDDGSVVCAGLMTPLFNAVVSAEREEGALAFLAREVRARSISLPGVTGVLPESELFRRGLDAGDECPREAPHDAGDLLAHPGASHYRVPGAAAPGGTRGSGAPPPMGRRLR